MTREEELDYRRSCPYDAMGDFSVFADSGEVEKPALPGEEPDRHPPG